MNSKSNTVTVVIGGEVALQSSLAEIPNIRF